MIYKRWELDEKTTCAKNAQVQVEWWRKVKREKNLYNFDLILAVWYITNSTEAINFRRVAITLLIAESNPKDKDIMVKLVMNLIN